MNDDFRENEEDSSKFENINSLEPAEIIGLQYSEYQHLQSMARGILGFTLAIIAIILTAVSAFYTPIPTPPSNPSEYQAALEAIPIEIPVAVVIFTVGMSALQAMIFLAISIISLILCLNYILDLLIPQSSFLDGLYSKSGTAGIDQIISENMGQLQVTRERYMQGSLRLIIAVLVGANSFIAYHLAVSLQVWTLLWLQLAYILPSAIISKAFRRLSNSIKSNNENNPLLFEALSDKGSRWETFQFRSYEKWLWALVTIISTFIFFIWILYILFNIVL